jgi:hypothetical protein
MSGECKGAVTLRAAPADSPGFAGMVAGDQCGKHDRGRRLIEEIRDNRFKTFDGRFTRQLSFTTGFHLPTIDRILSGAGLTVCSS